MSSSARIVLTFMCVSWFRVDFTKPIPAEITLIAGQPSSAVAWTKRVAPLDTNPKTKSDFDHTSFRTMCFTPDGLLLLGDIHHEVIWQMNVQTGVLQHVAG